MRPLRCPEPRRSRATVSSVAAVVAMAISPSAAPPAGSSPCAWAGPAVRARVPMATSMPFAALFTACLLSRCSHAGEARRC